MPLHSLYLRLPTHVFRLIAQGNARSEVESSKMMPYLPPIKRSIFRERLRVGYWTSELRHHPVSLLTEDVFGLQYGGETRCAIDFVILALCPDDGSEVSKRIQHSAGANFLRMDGLHHVDIYKQVVEQKFDILIDLDG